MERGLLYRRISVDSVNIMPQKDGYPVEAFEDSVLTISGMVCHDGKDYHVRCIEDGAFQDCNSIKHVVICDGIEEIHYDAFSGCANMESMKIPASVRKIGTSQFGPIAGFCNSLYSISVDEGNRIFDSREGCNAIICTENNSLINGCLGTKIPSSVERISRGAFYGCLIDSVSIPEGVKQIGDRAFAYCQNLAKIRISSTVDLIQDDAFQNCTNIMSITVDERNKEYDSRDNCNAIICGEELVKGCNMTVVPSGVEKIGRAAFANCYRMKEITIPEGVTTIGADAFYNCLSLKRISLPSTLTRFDTWPGAQFSNCISLDSIYIPENVSDLSSDIFSNCHSLRSIVVDSRNKTFDSRNKCNAIIHTQYKELTAGCSSTVIPDGVRYIARESFAGCDITAIDIPASVMSIDSTAFLNCTRLMSINVAPDNPYYKSDGSNSIVERKTGRLVLGCATTSFLPGVTSIGDYAFPSSPDVLILPEGIRGIGRCAFIHCRNLWYVSIPRSVTHVSKYAFPESNGLRYTNLMNSETKIE